MFKLLFYAWSQSGVDMLCKVSAYDIQRDQVCHTAHSHQNTGGVIL